MSNQNSIYSERLSRFNERKTELKRRSRWVGWIRLVVFILIGYIIIEVVVPFQNPFLFMGSIFGGIIIFLWPLVYHQHLFNQLEFVNSMIRINEYEISKNEKLYSDGSEYVSHSSLALDIDLVGPGSLYNLVNRCVTPLGNAKLVKALIDNPPDSDAIMMRQASVKELSPLIDFRQENIAIAIFGNSKAPGRKSFEATQVYLGKRFWRVLIVVWPFISLAAILLGIYVHSLFYFIPLIGWFLVTNEAKRIQPLFIEISGGSARWKSYAKLFEHFHKNKFNGEELKNLAQVTDGAFHALQKLGALSSRWEQRGNFFAGAFMNTLMLFDVKSAYEFEKWKQEHNDQFSDWLNAIGQIESLNSLATFSFNHPEYVYPSLKTGKPEITIQKMGHPLITADHMITNDIHLGHDGNVYVISGSNMSGKSTFLRAVGMNMILAQAGLPVFAESMTFTPLFIHTSFRQTDSVQENTSYFMAELKRLKEIMNAVDSGKGSMVLLDEILRGTNSEDKSHGSEILLEQLLSKNAITILATHDLKLGELEKRYPDKVVNYCFESEILNNDIRFDYKMKRGVAQNKNATFLMKKMGII